MNKRDKLSKHQAEVVEAKLVDMEVPGLWIPFDPDEADALGFFEEDALDEQDAADSACDLSQPVAPPTMERKR